MMDWSIDWFSVWVIDWLIDGAIVLTDTATAKVFPLIDHHAYSVYQILSREYLKSGSNMGWVDTVLIRGSNQVMYVQ